MIYLDYAAETPVDEEVLETFNEVSQTYIANPNSVHKLGRIAKERLEDATNQIAELLHVKTSEIIYTSGATEANNLAIQGIAEKYKIVGKHIITTYLEHSSVNGAVLALQNLGYEVDYVDIMKNGAVDYAHLKELIRDDTILVSICYVDSEIGLIQDVDSIGKLLMDYENCAFHVDATQAVCKIPVNMAYIDLATFAPHKFYGLGGCGVLIKKEKVELEPIIYGGISTTPYRSGTPNLPLIVATAKALSLGLQAIDHRYQYVTQLNKKLRASFEKYHNVSINSVENSSPFILNISISSIKSKKFIEYLDSKDIYLSSQSACCSINAPSRPVYAITKNRKAALSTLRVSLSHLTTMEEVEEFLKIFDEYYGLVFS